MSQQQNKIFRLCSINIEMLTKKAANSGLGSGFCSRFIPSPPSCQAKTLVTVYLPGDLSFNSLAGLVTQGQIQAAEYRDHSVSTRPKSCAFFV